MLFVILDNIRSALNVGAIFRTCDGAGVDRLYLTGITAYPPHNKIPKTALGAEEFVDWEHHTDPLEVINHLKSGELTKLREMANHKSEFENSKIVNEPTEIVCFELTDKSISMYDYKFNSNTALVFGHEITGIDEGIVKQSDATVHIPMYGKKKSLNIATSVGIGTYFYKSVQK